MFGSLVNSYMRGVSVCVCAIFVVGIFTPMSRLRSGAGRCACSVYTTSSDRRLGAIVCVGEAGAPDGSGTNFQEAGHGDGFDYLIGSPHLKHAHLRDRLCAVLDATIATLQHQRRPIEVLEVGAGHGFFTAQLRENGRG